MYLIQKLSCQKRILIKHKKKQTKFTFREDLFNRKVKAYKFNIMSAGKVSVGDRFVGKIRYAHRGTPCTVTEVWKDEITVEFDEPVRAITPGQALVLYDGDYVAGGGFIQ